MVDEKKQRTFDEIQAEYASLCTRAGHIQYQVFALNKDLELLNNTLRDLNLEGATAKQKADEIAAAVAAAKQKDTTNANS